MNNNHKDNENFLGREKKKGKFRVCQQNLWGYFLYVI